LSDHRPTSASAGKVASASAGKVASFGKGSAVGNGRNHRTCDERTDAWNRHQLPATPAPVCQLFDLLGNALDALIDTPPIAAEVLDDRDRTQSTKDLAFCASSSQSGRPLPDQRQIGRRCVASG
jgi:hypothetical protein